MTTLPLTINAAPADIRAALSAALIAENPVGSAAGRGSFKLFNSDESSTIYLLEQVDQPDGSISGIPILFGRSFPEDLDILPNGGLWCWSGADGTKALALILRWS